MSQWILHAMKTCRREPQLGNPQELSPETWRAHNVLVVNNNSTRQAAVPQARSAMIA